jgi:phosphopantothenoylcysteine decarboxylase/phosphopantothenate--cysteine ligase
MKGKQVIVGVTGGIAAYKAAELVRLLVREGASVRVAMTRNGARFVGPLTFEALSGERVIVDMWEGGAGAMEHIAWGQGADLVIIAPATANFIAKEAHGIADDFLSTMVLAAKAPILVCPSMNSAMFLHAATQENLRTLRARGVHVMDPEAGALACRTEGPGRLPEPEHILEEAAALLSAKDLSGLKVLVTAGPTVEPIDPVRYITNRSSGKMGYALARAARRRGAKVILVTGPTALTPPIGVELIPVKTAEEMREAVFAHIEGCRIVLKAAAVADYRPVHTSAHKIKKGEAALTLDLVQNPDILGAIGRERKPGTFLVGFAAETRDLLQNAAKKMASKNLDMIVANDVSMAGAGFESDTNIVKLIYRDGHTEDLPLMSKGDVADVVFDRIREAMEAGHGT